MKSLSSANADTCNNTIYASRQDTTASTDSNRSHDHPEIARIDRHNPLAYARDYIGRGWHVLPLAPTSKDPIEGWQWSKQRVDEQLCEFLFANATNNIGIALGDPSKGLIDIDLDWPEARDIADALISPDLPAFGRETARRTHRLVIATGKSRVEKFRLPTAANTDPRLPDEHCLCVTELRGTGGYTMFPGSIHPNGEAVTWETNCPDVLPERTWDELNHRMGLIAFLAVTVRCYPGRGVRDEFCMALAGTLLRSPLIKEDARIEAVDHLVELVARLAHDEEYRQRRKAQSSWKKMEAGEAVTGFPRMFELLGLPTPVADTLRKWINIGAEADGRPIIDLRSGELKIQLDRAEIALQSAHVPLFQRGRKLVRVIRCDFNAGQTSGIIRQAGSLCIEDVEPYWLSEQLQKAATFKRKEKATKPSHEFCNHLIIGRRGQWRWPVLKAFMETPTLRPDWTVLQEQAYDAATGIFLDFGPTTFGRVPEVP
ncbi:MAG TPA: bifunctional DNA primase/polymerase, partial [Xanthobacteraceae bacterium]